MGIIKHTTGDIFKSKHIPIVTVNCVGVMGAGIAKTCKMLYPRTYKQYRRKCLAGEYHPGQPILTNIERPLLLFPTKDHWRNPSQYRWIEEGLKRIAKNANKFDSLAIPPLGCGHGGLNWHKVLPMIERNLAPLENYFEIYHPHNEHIGDYTIQYLQYDDQGIHSKILSHDLEMR